MMRAKFKWLIKIWENFIYDIDGTLSVMFKRKSISKTCYETINHNQSEFFAGLMWATAFTTFSISLPIFHHSNHRNFITISKHQQQFYARFLWEKLFSFYFFFYKMFVVILLWKKLHCKANWLEPAKKPTQNRNKKLNVHYGFFPKEFASSVYNWSLKKW